MYLEYFGLKNPPFTLVTDPNYFFYGRSHCEALAHILFGVREGRGLVVILGEAGTGKTTLVRAALSMLQSTRVKASVVLNPMFGSAKELMEAILLGFDIEVDSTLSAMTLQRRLERFASSAVDSNSIPVVVIDEAQSLSREVLDYIRLLSNLEYKSRKLLQIIFSGQPEFMEILSRPESRALFQRIGVRYRLGALTPEEVWEYLGTRMAHAGCDGTILFSPQAAQQIHLHSRGLPRMINVLADNCLLAGYANGVKPITPELVRLVAAHLEVNVASQGITNVTTTSLDCIRATTSWKEIVSDIRYGKPPESLLKFLQGIQIPEINTVASAAVTE